MRQNHPKNLAPSIFSRFRKSAIIAVTVIALISFSGVFAFPILDLPTKLAGEILRLSMPTESQSAMANPHFRTAASGDWASNSTWEQSNDGGTSWIPVTTTPTAANSDSIVVRLGHFIDVTTAINVDQVSINEGDVAIESGGSLTVEDGPGTDLTLANLDATLQLEPGGVLVNNGQVNVSGSFFIGAGGSISGNSFVYGASSTLAYFLGTQTTSNTEFPSVSPPTTLIISDAEVTLHAPRTVLQVGLYGTGFFNIEFGLTVANGGDVVRRDGTASFIGTPNYSGSVTLTYSNADVTTGTEAGVPVTNLRVQQGTITLASDVTVTSSLALNFGYVITGTNKLTLEIGTVSSASGWVVGNFKKVFLFNAGLSQEQTFEVGTVNGYSPVSVTYSIGSSGTYEQTVKAVEGPHPILSDPTKALNRYWRLSNITGTGSASADLTFSYRNADVPVTANESSFVIQKYSNGLFTQPGGTVNITNNFATITGVSSFSDWTLAETSAVGAQNVATDPATNVGSTTATLNGQANPNGLDTTGWFRYSTIEPETCSDVFGTRFPASGGTSLGSGTESVPYSQMVEGLTPSTTYYFCAIAQNSAGTSFGAVLSFTPQNPNQPPVAVDDNVVATEDTPLNFPASSLLANDTDPDNDLLDIILPSPTTSQGGTVSLTVPGPLGIVTYTPPNNFTGTDTFIYIVTDGDLFDTGQVTVQVNPNIPPPTVNTAAASSVNGQSATLNGSANPNGSATTGWFRYSLSDPITCNDIFGTRTPTVGGVDVGSGTSAMPFSQGLSGLMPDATVYYCAIAQNAGGTSFGSVLSFTPQWVPPTVMTNAASSVGSTSATLNGTADPNGSETIGYFRFATVNPGTCNDAFGTPEGGSNLAGDGDVPFSEAIEGLSPGTTYFYCAIAQNSGGTAFGSVLQFTTSQLNAGISVNQSSLNFGDQTLGTTGPVQGVTITSTGTDPLVLGNVILVGDAGDFQFVQVPAAGTVLQPGESVTADFAFAPTALGLRSATLTIESNSFSSPSVELIGAGVVPDINVTPVSIDFGTVSTGLGGGVQQMQISNLGTGDLVIAGAAFTGPNAADFSSSQVTEVIIIPSGQTYPITIIFNPKESDREAHRLISARTTRTNLW